MIKNKYISNFDNKEEDYDASKFNFLSKNVELSAIENETSTLENENINEEKTQEYVRNFNLNNGLEAEIDEEKEEDKFEKIQQYNINLNTKKIEEKNRVEEVQKNNNRSSYYSNERRLKKEYITFEKVRKEYNTGSLPTIALDDVSFKIDEGELVIFLGQSGAGKTTALNMLGGMDSVTSGRIIVGDKEITNYDFEELTNYRRNDIGFIFQFYNLIANLSAKENVELSTEISKEFIDASIILEKVGLREHLDKFPSQLSGGEQQRVAIARAIAKKPKLLLCDEPTGALDYKTGKKVLKLIQDTCRNNNITTVIITHNSAVTPMADKVIYFNSGKVVDIKVNENPTDIEELEW